MVKSACIFGPYFKEERQVRGVSLWQVVRRTDSYLANIQRIEKGLSQPGLGLAFKMLKAIEVAPGDFLSGLAQIASDALPVSISPLPDVPVNYAKPDPSSKQKTLFGPLLAQARTASLVSQTAMAKAAQYNLRNINAVEKGIQEPGIMTALALVLATGVDVREFFNTLYGYWLELQTEGAT